MLLNQLTISSLRDKFLLHTKNGWEFDRERCFAFSEKPGVDEIKNLLTRYIITGYKGKYIIPKGKSVDQLSDELNYILCEGYERFAAMNQPIRPVGLHRLVVAIEKYIESVDGNVVYLTSDILPQLTPFAGLKIEQNPEEKLRTTKGWENVYNKVYEEIEVMKKLNPEYFKQPTNTIALPIAIKRFMQSESTYPSADIIPHMMLAGPPGVGKTTMANLIGKIYHDHGILETGFVKVVKADDLISDHVGGTFTLTNQAITDSEGGVLLIDEAYQLFQDPKDTHANYKKECIDVLTQALTDKTRHFMLILSGYSCKTPDSTDGVQALLKMNQGLSSRISCQIILEPYSPELLSEITVNNLEAHGYTLGKTVNKLGLIKYFEQIIRTSNRRNFANAREAVKLSKKLIIEAMKRSDDKYIEDADFPADVRGILLGKECGYDELLKQVERDYPGLGETVRSIATKAIASIKSSRERNNRRKTKKNEPLKSMVFVGNPGTGKNTIVNLLAQILGVCGIISGCAPITVSDPQHCTPEEFKEKMQAACDFNTLFFVDEAYDLPTSLVTSMLPQMTENPEFIAVFAVYPNEYESFLKKNKGLKSRIVRYDIPDYTPESLIKIFRSMCESEGYTYTDELIDDLGRLFKRWYETRSTNESYGNARDVENLLRLIAEKCDERTSDLTDENERYRMKSEDLPKEQKEVIENMKRNNDIENILSELNTYVGLSNLRNIIVNLYNTLTADKEILNVDTDYRIGHFLFTGDPGTGKTTGARLLGRALYAMGLLKSEKVTEISASDLIAGFVGQTADKAKTILTKGKYGIIFIDEAYMLDPQADTNHEDTFRREAITQLLLFMERENITGDTVVILAGYTDKMEKLLKNSCGLRSRIGTVVDFPNYNEQECLDICKKFLADNDHPFTLSMESEEVVRNIITLIRSSEEFSNARDMRNLAAQLISAAKERLVEKYHKNGSAEGITDKEKSEISDKDALRVLSCYSPANIYPM